MSQALQQGDLYPVRTHDQSSESKEPNNEQDFELFVISRGVLRWK